MRAVFSKTQELGPPSGVPESPLPGAPRLAKLVPVGRCFGGRGKRIREQTTRTRCGAVSPLSLTFLFFDKKVGPTVGTVFIEGTSYRARSKSPQVSLRSIFLSIRGLNLLRTPYRLKKGPANESSSPGVLIEAVHSDTRSPSSVAESKKAGDDWRASRLNIAASRLEVGALPESTRRELSIFPSARPQSHPHGTAVGRVSARSFPARSSSIETGNRRDRVQRRWPSGGKNVSTRGKIDIRARTLPQR